MRRPVLLLCLLALLYTAFLQTANAADSPKHEIRAVWLTTVYGLDWPKRPATSASGIKAQQQELCRILDKLQDANFNTIFLQVRLRGDVIWNSAIEPASQVFSGKTGTMPGYDPLAFAIEEIHKRGMECHAWFVTYPLGTEKSIREQGNLSVVKRHPELCVLHKGEWYLDPGMPGTSDYIISLVREVVNGYDIDGIHFDYIRYPEQAKSFPDKKSFARYGNKRPLSEWRRSNINQLMIRVYDVVKAEKPWVQVSSSPLGKYNRIPKMPNAGWTAYESVHQDPQYWMARGKQDMIVPMMYYLNNNFYPFVDDWVENSNGRLVVPGLGAYRMVKDEGDWNISHITDQIDYTRRHGGDGSTFFRTEHVLDNPKGLYSVLKDNYYQHPALLPPLNWLNADAPGKPQQPDVELIGDELKISWQPVTDQPGAHTYTLYFSTIDSINTASPASILLTGIRETTVFLPVDLSREAGYTFSVSASSRYHIESKPSNETFYYLINFPK